MIPSYNVVENYTGTGLLDTYSFEFKISDLSELLILILDDDGEEVSRVRGDDDTGIVASATFDAANGGGEVVFTDPIGDDYTLLFFLAPDEPTQDYEFSDKFSFNLKDFERALDRLEGPIQRAIFLSNRSVRLNDGRSTTLPDLFDPQLPAELTPNASIVIDDTGLKLVLGPTAAQLAQATVDAAAAAASAAAAVVSAAAAAASAALVASFTGFIRSGPFSVLNNANSNLLGELFDSTVYTQIDYIAKVTRNSTVFARIEFSIFFRNSAWEIAVAEIRYADAAVTPGITFTVDSVTGQINAAADNGAGNATITLDKVRWAI